MLCLSIVAARQQICRQSLSPQATHNSEADLQRLPRAPLHTKVTSAASKSQAPWLHRQGGGVTHPTRNVLLGMGIAMCTHGEFVLSEMG